MGQAFFPGAKKKEPSKGLIPGKSKKGEPKFSLGVIILSQMIRDWAGK